MKEEGKASKNTKIIISVIVFLLLICLLIIICIRFCYSPVIQDVEQTNNYEEVVKETVEEPGVEEPVIEEPGIEEPVEEEPNIEEPLIEEHILDKSADDIEMAEEIIEEIVTEEEIVEEPEYLKPEPIVAKFSLAYSETIGDIVVYNGKIIVADKFGVISASDFTGKRFWSITSSNNPNELSSPVIIGSNVYFSGAKEFIIGDADTGRVYKRIDLDEQSAHFFGRRVVLYNGQGLFPVNDGIRFIKLDTGKTIREISVPGGSRMTPAVYKNKIVIVNQIGVFFIINPDDGSIEASIETSLNQPVGLGVEIKGDLAFIGDRTGTIVGISLASKELVWENNLSGGERLIFYQNLVCSHDGIYAFAGSTLFALSLSRGILLFEPIGNLSSPPLYHEGLLYYGTNNGYLHVTEALTGRFISSLKIDERITTRPIMVNNRLIIGTELGTIFIINPEGL